MDDDDFEASDRWARQQARRKDRISQSILKSRTQLERDRYAFHRGTREHILDPMAGFGDVMAQNVKYAGARLETVADYSRAELDEGDIAATDLLRMY